MKKVKVLPILILLILFFNIPWKLNSCTNFLVTKGASSTGSTMITYSADAHVLYGELYYWPASDHPADAMLDVYEWDTGKYLGKIPQVAHTYNVVGNINENQVAISETTFTGRQSLIDTTGIIDYGSLIYITLQRAKTARDAIKIMSGLVNTHGYYSSGESFSISDKDEVWIMEMIGKSPGNKGAVWVARMIPDGFVSGHANQARITTFPLAKGNKTSITSKELDKIHNKEVTTVYAYDVIDVARKFGWFEGKDEDFSFSDIYAPLDFGAARFCEMRVWSFFKEINDDMDHYFEYASGHDPENRMPLWIKPNRKLNNLDLMHFMRDYLQGTPLDMTKDPGAGPFGMPYRWRPLTWSDPDDESQIYCNERAVATQQTGFSFVAESRNWLPDPIGGVLWFGVDNTLTTCYSPMYCGMQEIPEPFIEGNGDLLTYSPTSAFWTFSFVSNFAYLRHDSMIIDIQKVQNELESKYTTTISAIDKAAVILYDENEDMAIDFITNYSVSTANNTVDRWKELGNYLLVKYIDGNIKKEKNGKFERNPYGNPVNPHQPGYPNRWKRDVIKATGDKLKMPDENN